LERNGIPVIGIEDLDINWLNGFPYAERRDLLHAIDHVRNKGKSEAEKNLIDIIEDYSIKEDWTNPSSTAFV
jgi:predicted RNase H-like nuclease (RuvC/YqgF family)